MRNTAGPQMHQAAGGCGWPPAERSEPPCTPAPACPVCRRRSPVSLSPRHRDSARALAVPCQRMSARHLKVEKWRRAPYTDIFRGTISGQRGGRGEERRSVGGWLRYVGRRAWCRLMALFRLLRRIQGSRKAIASVNTALRTCCSPKRLFLCRRMSLRAHAARQWQDNLLQHRRVDVSICGQEHLHCDTGGSTGTQSTPGVLPSGRFRPSVAAPPCSDARLRHMAGHAEARSASHIGLATLASKQNHG